jgi:hypothetical protein
MYIFLDESGQFTPCNHEQYFVVAAFTVGKPRRTEKAIRGWYKNKFPIRMRNQSEIKFSDKKIPIALRLKTLKFISNLDVRVHYVYLQRKNIPNNFRSNDKLRSGHLYTHIIGELLEMFLPITDMEFRAFCDQRHLKRLRRSEFKQILTSHLLPLLPAKSIVEVEMIDSTVNTNIQIADWIVGAVAWKLEKKQLGTECHDILKNNILGSGKELFKNHPKYE